MSATEKSAPSSAAMRSTWRRVRLQDVEPRLDRGRQGPGRGTPDDADPAGLRGAEAAAAHQRVEQLGEVQRVARGAGRQLEQAAVRLAAAEGAHQLRHRLLAQRPEPEPGARGHAALDREHVAVPRRQAQRPDQQQGQLLGQPRQPAPDRQRRRVAPLEVVQDEDRRLGERRVADRGDDLLAGGGDEVVAGLRGTGAVEEPGGDRVPVDVTGRPVRQGLEQGSEQQWRRQFVAGTPEHAATLLSGTVGGQAHEHRLADARLTHDEERAALAATECAHPAREAGQFGVPADYTAGWARRHG